MSVQLVLYPQNYKGKYSASTIPVSNEYVADNQNFNTVNSFAGYDSTANDVGLDAINNSVGIAAWKRFRSTGGTFATVTMPSQSYANKLELYSANGSTSSSGVYQKIINLTQNTVYDLTINITQAGAGGLLVIGTQGNITSQYDTLGGQTLFTFISAASTGTQTLTFTANSSEEILLISYLNDNGDTVYINNISIQESAQQPTLVFTDLDDGQVICDLYEDEDIPLSLSIDNFKNAAEKVQSYSKDFNLPATKRNNKIFTHLFEVTKTQDAFSFNPYVKTECILKQDGYNIFKGYLRIIDIVNQEGEISYNVNLYSEGIALADTLKEKTFNDLATTFSELDHNYNKANIKASWDSTGVSLLSPLGFNSFAGNQGDTNTQVLKYPFVETNYAIAVSRAQEDMNIHLLIDAYKVVPDKNLAIISNWDISDYGRKLFEENQGKHKNIFLLRGIYDQEELDFLRGHSSLYLHSHSLCGTAPSLVEAMSLDLPVVAFDVPTNRYTTENKALYFQDVPSLVRLLKELRSEDLESNKIDMSEIARRRYRWPRIVDKYQKLLSKSSFKGKTSS